MPADILTETDYITVELHVRPELLRTRSSLSRQEQLAEDDALAVLLGRTALVKARAALSEADES